MYNRYIRNDQGVYARVPQEEPPTKSHPSSSPEAPKPQVQSPPPSGEPSRKPPLPGKPKQLTDGLTGVLRHILDQLRLEQVDTGDLLLLGLLFLLFREDADEELLVALGLLLIL